jgi:hypothetical protein
MSHPYIFIFKTLIMEKMKKQKNGDDHLNSSERSMLNGTIVTTLVSFSMLTEVASSPVRVSFK